MIDPLSLSARRIAVIAPHADDESLGCGGLIAALAADERAVMIIVITDGGASHRSVQWPRQRLAARRREEAIDAAGRLGVGVANVRFLDLPDAAMPDESAPLWIAACARMAGWLRDFGPDLVLQPWRRDPHCDHRDAWRLTQAALVQVGLTPELLEYAVWLDELGAPEDQPAAAEAERVAFDIGDVLDAKRAAVACHLTQTTDLIDDDPEGFRLTQATIDRLVGPTETYWRPLS